MSLVGTLPHLHVTRRDTSSPACYPSGHLLTSMSHVETPLQLNHQKPQASILVEVDLSVCPESYYYYYLSHYTPYLALVLRRLHSLLVTCPTAPTLPTCHLSHGAYTPYLSHVPRRLHSLLVTCPTVPTLPSCHLSYGAYTPYLSGFHDASVGL